jgi:hypothetical protein
MQCKTGYDVGCVCIRGQQRDVECARVRQLHMFTIREVGNNEHSGREDVCGWSICHEEVASGT